MITSSNGNIFRITGPLCGEFTGPGEFPTQRPVTRSFDVFFDLRLNKRLSKQSWCRWFETPSWSLWRHWNGSSITGHNHEDVMTCKRFRHYWSFLREIGRSWVDSFLKGSCGPELLCIFFGAINNQNAGDSRRRPRNVGVILIANTFDLRDHCTRLQQRYMTTKTSKLNCLSTVCSVVYTGWHQSKHELASLALC